MSIQPMAYPINDFCRAVGIGRSKTYEMIASGELRAVKIGGRTVITASEVQRLIDAAQPAGGLEIATKH